MIQLDIWQLFISLLVVALLQEFIIKPGVDMIKKYMLKSRKQFMGLFNGENNSG